jgi:hypothetical protein
MAGDTFLDPKTRPMAEQSITLSMVARTARYGASLGGSESRLWIFTANGCPSPTRNRLVETTAGAFSQPEGANRWRRAKVDETFGTAMAEKSLDFVDLQSFENGQPCIGHLGLRFFLRPNGSVPHALCLLRGWAVGNGELVGHAPAGLIDQQHGAGAG